MNNLFLVSLFLGVVLVYTYADAKSYMRLNEADMEESREKRSSKNSMVFLVSNVGGNKKKWINCTLPCQEVIEEAVEGQGDYCLENWLPISPKHFQHCWICRSIFKCGAALRGSSVFNG